MILPFFSQVLLGGAIPLEAVRTGEKTLRDRALLKEFLEYLHIQKGLLEAYNASYPLIEARELLPSFEINFAEYKHLPSFSMVVLNRPLDYQQEVFQFDLLYGFDHLPPDEATASSHRLPPPGSRDYFSRVNLDRLLPHLTKELRTRFKQEFAQHDPTNLRHYYALLTYLFHMDRAHVIAKDAQGDFRILGTYASFPSDLDTELKALGRRIGKFKDNHNQLYEQNRSFVYQFLMESYGFPIASERRTSSALFARKLSRLKEPYLIKVLGNSDRTITSLSGFELKRHPLVEKVALVALPPGLEDIHRHCQDKGFYLDPKRRVVIVKVTYRQHTYNRRNVQEDRALSVVKQEIIHPVTGAREEGFNILKDTKSFLIDLNDIVRGEYLGSISYRREGQITSIKNHDDRLKFLDAFLSKNQRRITGYSQEFFDDLKRVLNGYILNPDYRPVFKRYPELHRDLIGRIAYLQQSHQLQQLEKLVQRRPPYHRRLSLAQILEEALAFLEAHREDIPIYHDDLFDKLRHLLDQLDHHPYLKSLDQEQEDNLAPYARTLASLRRQLRLRLDQIIQEHRHIKEAHRNGSLSQLLFTTRLPAQT